MYQPFFVKYDFETKIVKIDNQTKLKELRKNTAEFYTVKNVEQLLKSIELSISYLEENEYEYYYIGENQYFCYRGEHCLAVFVKKIKKKPYTIWQIFLDVKMCT